MFDAISAASTQGKVPEPHIGSAKSQSPLQPVFMIIPAAKHLVEGRFGLFLR